MGAGAIYNISLIAAFAAGVVALFAPCCISYLLPAYFGNVFKEKKRVLTMTLIYSAGIFAVMLPIVLGARVLAQLFWRLHDTTYVVGGAVMLVVGVLALFGLKLPMPHFRQGYGGQARQADVVSTFILGVVGGVTSACCAPVLIGVLTLSALSPTILLSLGVGAAYVLGMVAPLYLASLLIDRGNILERSWLKKQWGTIRLGRAAYPIYGSNLLAAFVFVGTGMVLLGLAWSGKLGMPADQSGVTTLIYAVAERVTAVTGRLPFINVLFALVLASGLYWFVRQARAERKRQETGEVDCCHPK